ncbi:hypothetical protein [Diplocloster agilis]|uniref:Uncharacterized protein n=1 Tax=Diplocloster agilis TaxID=2850323 RepID=A0A949NEA2_9FIRM|nr:hypothetical protein [Diplocloster agilis]MBU9736159.1 hypothetical protein [Diplocloster agilis]
MTGTHMMLHEIIEEHHERIGHIRKYYPYFKLAETSFTQFKDGKYSRLDMGYILLAVLRFFIEENNFKEKEVLYSEYETFVTALLRRDFECYLEEEENKELVSYIFDKITNEGKPFRYDYFDPADRKQKTIRMRLIKSSIQDGAVRYSITSEAVEFYLDTKEIKEESTISVEQLLLEKLINSQNFRQGAEVVRRINNEVSRLQSRKNEVLRILGQDVFEGVRAYEEFLDTGMRWFEEEQHLFRKNSELIHKALERAAQDEASGEYTSQYYRAMDDIYALELELKKAVQKHSELLTACTQLQKQADERILKARVQSLRSSFDFRQAVSRMMERDRADLLGELIRPLANLKIRKSFYLPNLDHLLTYRPDQQETGEKIGEQVEETYIYEDEAIEQRIYDNFEILLSELFHWLRQKKEFTLKEWNGYLEEKYTERIFRNGDYYTFLIHICLKEEYRVQEVRKNPDTFFEEIMNAFLDKSGNRLYEDLAFAVRKDSGVSLQILGLFEVTNLIFERRDMDGQP